MLEVANIKASYGKFQVLENISFSVQQGTFLGILGRNGVGKTTLLKVIAGAVKPSSGGILLNGKAIHSQEAFEIANEGLALVLDRKGIFRNLTVLENLQLAHRIHRTKKIRWTIDAIFDMFPRLAERATAYGGGLSGGEQQMLAIGRALMTQPQCVLFDEPTEGLAPKIVDELVDLLQRLRVSGLTAIVVDQRLETVFDTCNEVLVMSRGSVAMQGNAKELRERADALTEHLGV